MSGHFRSTVTTGLLIATAVAVLASPVFGAHEPARLGLTPVGDYGTYFEITVEPGQTLDLQVEAANFGHEEAVARTYAANVYSIVNGGFGASLFGERPTGTTAWITFPTQELTLGPEDAVVMDVQVTVPEGTAPGQYIAALVIENAEPVRGTGTIAVDQINRSAIAIDIDVPGTREPDLSITEIGHAQVGAQSVVTFGVDNPGNVHLQPGGDFAIRDDAGEEIASGSTQMDSVYAGTSTVLEVPGGEVLSPGEYCGGLTLTDEDTGATASTECLPFTVLAPASGDEAPFGLPSVTQAVDAVGGPTIVVPALLVVFGIGTAGIVLGLRRRRRRALAAPDGASGGWPIADTEVRCPRTLEPLSAIIGTLRRALREEPRIARAWIVERDSAFILAIEGVTGITPADAARLAAEVQERADRELGLVMPMQVMFNQGSGPVSRMTADLPPFYVRQAAT